MGRAARARVIDRYINGYVLGLTVGFYRTLIQPSRKSQGNGLKTLPEN
jgi:hypothetical protein